MLVGQPVYVIDAMCSNIQPTSSVITTVVAISVNVVKIVILMSFQEDVDNM